MPRQGPRVAAPRSARTPTTIVAARTPAPIVAAVAAPGARRPARSAMTDPARGGHSRRMRSRFLPWTLAFLALVGCEAAPSVVGGISGPDASDPDNDAAGDASRDGDGGTFASDAGPLDAAPSRDDGECPSPLPAECVPGTSCRARCNRCTCEGEAGAWGCTLIACP